MGSLIDLKGKRFERLYVIERSQNNKYGNSEWLCQCDCGKQIRVRGASLITGNTKSCGCLQAELVSKRSKTHGKSKTKLYQTWFNIKRRCFDPKNKEYNCYGGRGITMCSSWSNSYEKFYDYVSSLPYFGEPGYTIDRINNDGNYEPGNIRWSDITTQANNRSNNHLITYNGKTQTLAEWAREKSLNYQTLEMRINKFNWTIEKALSTPGRKKQFK